MSYDDLRYGDAEKAELRAKVEQLGRIVNEHDPALLKTCHEREDVLKAKVEQLEQVVEAARRAMLAIEKDYNPTLEEQTASENLLHALAALDQD